MAETPAAAPLPIRMGRLDDHDLDAFIRFLADHFAESGQQGLPHFALSRRVVRDELRANIVGRWAKRLDEPLWGRAWLLWSAAPEAQPRAGFNFRVPNAPPARVVGHLELKGGRIPAEMHRATLGMGLLREYTAKGHGRRLMEAAIAWARTEAKLEWIDLGVFSHNLPARKLYRSMGFVEHGTRPDAFRIDAGLAVDDVMMALDLRG